MTRKGCTVVELLVVGGILLGIVGATGALGFGSRRAKEAEVKQNLHAIQLAAERFAVDNDGDYPVYLYGGDARFNIGTMNYYNPAPRSGTQYFDQPLHHPFDLFWLDTEAWNYHDATWEQLVDGQPREPFGDRLAYEGYLPRYPANPFLRQSPGGPFSLAGLELLSGMGSTGAFAGYGGQDGTAMWNLGCFGELPQLACDSYGDSEPRLDFPGSFYYHPRFGDEATATGHLEHQAAQNPGAWWPGGLREEVRPPVNDTAKVRDAPVWGYDLVGFGAGGPKSHGMDLDNSVGAAGYAHFFRTGYLTLGHERNPWVTAGTYGDNPDIAERPYSDGVPDFMVIHLGSGVRPYPNSAYGEN